MDILRTLSMSGVMVAFAMLAEEPFAPCFSDALSVEATRLHLNVVGAYRLVSDKTKFHLNNMTSLEASLPSYGTDCLGNQQYPSITYFQDGAYRVLAGGIGNVVELCGNVSPSDFQSGVSLLRDRVGEYIGYIFDGQTIVTGSANSNIPRGNEPNVNDLSSGIVRDDDPLPNGHIYDVDTPGIHRIPREKRRDG